MGKAERNPPIKTDQKIGVDEDAAAMNKIKGIGERIKKVRGNLTQPELAEMVNLHRNAITSWESDKVPHFAKALLCIYENFGINLNWLISGEGDPYIKGPQHTYRIENKVVKLELMMAGLEKKVAGSAKDT